MSPRASVLVAASIFFFIFYFWVFFDSCIYVFFLNRLDHIFLTESSYNNPQPPPPLLNTSTHIHTAQPQTESSTHPTMCIQNEMNKGFEQEIKSTAGIHCPARFCYMRLASWGLLYWCPASSEVFLDYGVWLLWIFFLTSKRLLVTLSLSLFMFRNMSETLISCLYCCSLRISRVTSWDVYR